MFSECKWQRLGQVAEVSDGSRSFALDSTSVRVGRLVRWQNLHSLCVRLQV
jgi:hypothetical protein